jgi:two-component system CheB/CheR fusion protein
VRDTGIGITPELLPHVFDLFMQAERSIDRAQGGLGIGLTLVRSLVEMHGGTVQAFSEGLGKGSEFVVRLPVSKGKSKKAARPEKAPSAGAAPRRVLVVDDNVDAAESLATMIRTWGHEVRVAYDGPEALAVVPPYHPDLILLDIGLPGMSGYQVARSLRRQPEFKEVRLVALTGYGQEEDRRRSKEAGFDQHLVKPVEPNSLRKLLAR